MRIALILPDIKDTLGPGNRLVIWTQGCLKKCFNCETPEHQDVNGGNELDIIKFLKETDLSKFDGVTISGGEPFIQNKELLEVVKYLSKYIEDICIYSGYQYEELSKDPINQQIFDKIAVLIDGEYIENQNLGEKLKGSANQRIIVFKEKYREPYESLNKQEREQVDIRINSRVHARVGLKKKKEDQ